MRLKQEFIDYLVAQPEAGMGYQRVKIKLRNGLELVNIIVLNSEDLLVPEDIDFSMEDIGIEELEIVNKG